ncbi:MAG: hypothetical protein WBE72_06010 [Terracidiphilus sp.]
MELSPVPGLRAFAAVKAPPADFQLSTVLDIDAVARPGNSSRSGARQKAAGAEELEADDLTLDGEDTDSSPDATQSRFSVFA